MAGRGEELVTRIVASDEASAVVAKVAGAVGELEDHPVEIPIGVDEAKVKQEIETLDRRLDGLTKTERRVVLNVAADKAQADINRLTRDLANAQKFGDEEIAIRLEARGNAEAKLQAIRSEVRDLDGETVNVNVEARGLDGIRSQLEGLGGPLGGMAAAFATPTGGAVALAAGLGLAADNSADLAIAADEIANLTGASVENASRLLHVMGASGVEATDMADILGQMNQVLSQQPELAAELGVNLEDGKDTVARFIEVVGRLGVRYDDVGERSLAAAQLFGEEGVRQVNSVIARVGDLAVAVENVPKVNIADEADVTAARKTKDEIAGIKQEADGIANILGQAALPVIGFAVGQFGDHLDRASGAGENLRRSLTAVGREQDEIIDDWDRSARLAEEFNLALVSGLTDYASVHAAVFEVTGDITAAGIVANAWATTNADKLAPGLADVAAKTEDIKTAAENLSGALVGSLASAWDKVTEAGRTAIETMISDAQAARDAILSGISDPLEAETGVLDLLDDFEQVNQAGADAFQAQADGADDARTLARAYQREVNNLTIGATRYLEEVLKIPAERTTQLRTLLSRGDIIGAEEEFNRLTAQWQINPQINLLNTSANPQFRMNPGGAPTLVPGTGAATVSPSALGAFRESGGTHTYVLAPSPGQVVAAQRDYAFGNGYQ